MASATLLVRSNSVPTCPAVGIIWIPATIRRDVFKGCAVVAFVGRAFTPVKRIFDWVHPRELVRHHILQ
jgi:hypothetical protein